MCRSLREGTVKPEMCLEKYTSVGEHGNFGRSIYRSRGGLFGDSIRGVLRGQEVAKGRLRCGNSASFVEAESGASVSVLYPLSILAPAICKAGFAEASSEVP